MRNKIFIKLISIVCLLILIAGCSRQIAPAATSTTEPTKTVTATSTLEPTKTSVTVTSTPEPTVTPKATKETFTDPFSYCAAVGTIDTPDACYTGIKIPDEIINGFKRAVGLEASSEPIDMFKKTTIWRCMNNKVYACNFGANLPCDSKANTDKTPSQDIDDYCAANPESDFIPMSVTGHTTIYSWHCVKDIPEPLDQIEKVDAAGY
jgi:hypothetical protein